MNGLKIKIALGIIVGLFAASSAYAAIANTKHDLSFFTTAFEPLSSYATTEPEICIFCHTPHGGDNVAPLWNRSLPAAGAFTFYSSSTTTAAVNSVAAINDESLLCLSCHDGSIAINSLLNTSPSGTPVVMEQGPGPVPIFGSSGANPRIGGAPGDESGTGHLEDDHPISFNYSAAATDVNETGLEPAPTNAALRLFNGNMECSTCHEVHDNAIPPFLAMDNTGSAMCLACHIK